MQKYYYGFVKEERTNDCVQMTFLSPFNDGFERWLITFADHAEVVIPDSLKTKLKELVSNIHQKISWLLTTYGQTSGWWIGLKQNLQTQWNA